MQYNIVELKDNELVGPSDCVKSIEKLTRATYGDHGSLLLVVGGIDMDDFDEMYHKAVDDNALRKMLEVYSKTHKELYGGEPYDFIRLSD